METKFTKGEWVVIKSPKYHVPECSTIEIHSGLELGWICKVQNNGVIDDEKGLANAKLIAAAPELLDALNYTIESIEPKDVCRGKFKTLGKEFAYVGCKSMPTDEAILRCIEAIKKATE